MRSLYSLIAGFAVFGFIGFFAASVFGACIGLIVAYWRDGILARVYYGIMVLPFFVAIVFFFGDTVRNLLVGTPINFPQVALCVGFVAGIGNWIRAFYHRPSKSLLLKPPESPRGRIYSLIDRSIFLLSWTSILMFSIDLIFFAPKGSFLVNFTWLSVAGLVLYSIALVLLIFRRIFLKQRQEHKWKMEKK
jgi:hypothetical protein